MKFKYILNHDVRFTALNQLWRLISGPMMLIVIPIFLNPEEQGFWYTIIGLAALGVLADLGFTSIVLQFSAHEYANLDKNPINKILLGNEYYIQRISSLFHFIVNWTRKVTIVIFPLIFCIGCLILSQHHSDIAWFFPWLIYSIGSIIIFLNNVVLSFIEGCENVGDVQKIRFYMSFVNIILTLIGLYLQIGLFALSIAFIFSASIGSVIILKKYILLLQQLYIRKDTKNHSWGENIFPLLKKYAITWIGGYFSFSIFTPIAFYYYGAIEAGKVGLSIALWSAIFSISNIWITVVVPKINILVAKKNYIELNTLFYRHLKFALFTFVFGMIVFFNIYFYFYYNKFIIVDRFIDIEGLILVSSAWLLQIIISSFAVYMRAHKIELLVKQSLFTGLYIVVTTLFSSYFFPFEYFFIGFLSSYFFSIFWVFYIFKNFKRGI